ncbi:MAG: hypothetical protein IPK72_23455 [Candidatus Eisenbacteria bacterium]|nr:hypothetical protein [Candidatus Eisenbacteria bacterium]
MHETDLIREASSGAHAAVLAAHPFLNPRLSEAQPAILRHLYKRYLAMRESSESYNEFLNKILRPVDEQRPLQSNLVSAGYYMNEAVHYINELLMMVPPGARPAITPRNEVMRCLDVLELLGMIFGSDDPRVSFEAQRKLYLTKLFFEVDHCLDVQRGNEHREHFERLMRREIFASVPETRRVEVCFAIRPDGQSMEYSLGRTRPGQECWSFDLQEVELTRDGRPTNVHIYYYACRFKREVIPFQYERGADRYELAPTELWPGLTKRRSASIVSKMIRKGETDPKSIKDLIGAMFIVENPAEMETLRDCIYDLLGGIFRVKNVVDTTLRGEDRSLLNPYSGMGYKVYKCEIDVLYNSERNPAPLPYIYGVELQLYTLENYLRTIHSHHYANHQALKRRQFLQGLLPYLFPHEIYGPEAIEAALHAGGHDGLEPPSGEPGPA